MNIFGNTKHQIAELKHDLANTTRLAIDINCAVDRLNTDLKKALDWISTADGVIINLSNNVQKTVNLTADRLERLNDRVTRLSDEMTCTSAQLDTVNDVARTAACDIDSVNTKVDSEVMQLDARLGTLNDATTEAVKLAFSQINELRAALNHNTRWVAERFGVEVKDDAAPVPPVAEPVVECVDELTDAEITARAEQFERLHARRERRRRARAAQSEAA